MQLVAQDLVRRFGNDLSRVAVIFPNKRASLFLNQELVRAYAHACGAEDVALWSPAYVTISDFFRRRSTLVVADQIYLVCRLYDVYVRCTGNKSETLDQFYSWGVVLLADFDDIDKNMADAKKVFQIVADLHELDNIDYLDDEQREALKEFFSSFTDSIRRRCASVSVSCGVNCMIYIQNSEAHYAMTGLHTKECSIVMWQKWLI